MNAATIDVSRLIRLCSFALAVLAGCAVYFTYEARVDAAQLRLDDAQANLLSDDVAFESTNRLRAERAGLARRYDTAFVRNPEAVFLRELASTAARRGVTLVSTSIAQDAPADASAAHSELFKRTQVSIELRGTYAHLLAAVRDLSIGSAIVGVDAPTIRRDNGLLVATIPVTMYEPAGAP